ncbi:MULTISPECIES: DUF523 and DUF1722 domain-containing protein [unclassified Legionella]|uniref:YbgA family protein n=1 Tax=unclassified Legionella TaxID=2622702 RepID=UPI0010551615|nr:MULTISPECIES: DUF523 and DUF1722 domain-containing protein [unclassified Legionella]MDI9819429.1 DUF523 and DUF1722 domain-containing protein [Legionella sp. PL877]
MKKRIVLGVSSCLLGDKVRFDGGHKRDNYICDFLAGYVEFFPICPEVSIGLGIPRPAIRLSGDPQNPKLVEVNNPRQDYTMPMREFSQNCVPQLGNISGYILKSKSPTCGWKRVRVYQDKGQAPLSGQGIFARILESNYPYLPIEEEGRLNEPRLRENFIERLFIYKEWQELIESGLTAAGIIRFHTRHKLILMAHNPVNYRILGQKISHLKNQDWNSFVNDYINLFMKTLSCLATPKKHANVLQHCFGYFKKILGKLDKEELLEAIDSYRRGLLPLIVPITLLKHHLKHYPQAYLENQSYLSPYPAELMLRNHI